MTLPDPADPWCLCALDRGDGPVRLAVKDCIDVAGVPTTSGSALVAATAPPAERDAEVVARLLAHGHRVVAKTNLDEFCFGATGVNPWFGTPRNPLDPDRIPGGSSSGSAVAVATGRAEVALGTDTTGSARTPAAFCGVVGLKLGSGAVPMDGVRPLAPTLDSLGILAARTGPVRVALEALAVGAAPDAPEGLRAEDTTLLRFEVEGSDPALEAAVDRVLDRSGFRVDRIEVPGWTEAAAAARAILFSEAPAALDRWVHGALDRVGPDVRRRFEMAAELTADELDAARATATRWRSQLRGLCADGALLVSTATLTIAPRIEDRSAQPNAAASPVNLAGLPAIVGPTDEAVPGTGLLGSIQLVGPDGAEQRLCDVLDLLCPSAAAAHEAIRGR